MLFSLIQSVLAGRHNLRAHAWQSAANYSQQIFGLVLGVLLARLLSPQIFGEFAYVSAVVGLVLLPFSWSLAPQIVAEIRTNPNIVNDALWVSRRVILGRALGAALACLYLGWTSGGQSALLGAVVAIPLVGAELVAVLRASLEGRGHFNINFWDSILSAAFTAAIALPSAWLGAGVWSLALPGVPFFLIQLWFFSRTSGHRSLQPFSAHSNRSYFRSGSALWVSSLGEGALMRLDKFFLAKFSTLDAVGDYNRASNYAPLSARILNSLLTNPTVAALTRAEGSRQRRALIVKSASLLLAGSLINFIVLWGFSDPLVPLVFGPQWTSAIPVFEAMAPLSLVLSIAYLPVAGALAERAYTRIAVSRLLVLAVFVTGVLVFKESLNAPLMACMLQGALLLQGISLVLMRFSR